MATRKQPARKKLTQAERAKMYKSLGMEPPKTARQLGAEAVKAAKALPVEVRRTFWREMMAGKTVGEARIMAGIEDILVALELVDLCHRKVVHRIPLTVEEIV